MIAIRPAGERGSSRGSGRESQHGFPSGTHADPQRFGLGPLRVVNEHRIAPDGEVADERRANMEILTWVVAGCLDHRDSVGGDAKIGAGGLLHLAAGSGIRHCDRNALASGPLHVLELWIQPDRLNSPPRAAHRTFASEDLQGRLCLVAAGDAPADGLAIAQDVRVYASRLDPGDVLATALDVARHTFIQVLKGSVRLADVSVAAGDSIAVAGEPHLYLAAEESAELLWLDLPASRSC